MIAASPKRRHEVAAGKIRALYGHSLPDRLLKVPAPPPKRLFHGTAPAAVAKIREAGLLPMGRQYVHLSVNRDEAVAVGKRKAPVPIILLIRARDAWNDGVTFYSGNERVWLADGVPWAYIAVTGERQASSSARNRCFRRPRLWWPAWLKTSLPPRHAADASDARHPRHPALLRRRRAEPFPPWSGRSRQVPHRRAHHAELLRSSPWRRLQPAGHALHRPGRRSRRAPSPDPVPVPRQPRRAELRPAVRPPDHAGGDERRLRARRRWRHLHPHHALRRGRSRDAEVRAERRHHDADASVLRTAQPDAHRPCRLDAVGHHLHAGDGCPHRPRRHADIGRRDLLSLPRHLDQRRQRRGEPARDRDRGFVACAGHRFGDDRSRLDARRGRHQVQRLSLAERHLRLHRPGRLDLPRQ